MPKGVATSEYSYLLKDEDVKRWYDNVSRGSIITAHTWLRRLGLIHKKFNKTPKQIASMPSRDRTNFLLDVITQLEKNGISGSYIANIIKALKNWLEFCGKPVQQRIKIHGRNDLVKFADEKPPNPEELGRIFNAADLRARAASAVIAFSGVRLEILGDYLGTDGLMLKDIEATINGNSIEFEDMPMMITVRRSLSKTGNQFFTFLCEEGCNYLKQYLEWRLRGKERLGPNSPIITPLQKRLAGEHIRTINIGDLIRKPIRAAGFQWRPYVLRRYFDTRLMMAESDGLIIKDWRVFWMGHHGDMEAVYTVNKGLPKDAVEKMRDSYAKAAQKYLITTRKEGMTEEKIVQTMNRQFLIMSGYSEEELKDIDVGELTPQQFQDLIQKKSIQSLGLNGNGRQKVVPMDSVRQYIQDGWEFVSPLNGSEAIIRLPEH